MLKLIRVNEEVVITVESRDHAKKNGVSPKDHTSRVNKLNIL